MTAYQITSMLEGVVQRGTGDRGQAVGKPIAGKTGTTNDYKDAWFVGFSPDLVVGVYIGYDKPRSLGTRRDRRRARGADLHRVHEDGAGRQAADAVPRPAGPRTSSRSTARPGFARQGGGAGIILEAFKPGTGAARHLLDHRLSPTRWAGR